MAIFNQPSAPKRDIPATPEPIKPAETALKREPDPNEFSPVSAAPISRAAPAPAERSEGKESLIASDLTIEGKIEGAGHIRIAGRFKGDVHVQGDLTIEVGAKLNGGVRARKVIIAGELEGNIESAQRVELLSSGVMVGDLKAETLTVASGSRMKGQVDFGGDGKTAAKGNAEPGAAS
jgi:cytoskeletal protein CcmA (bactofilin family)